MYSCFTDISFPNSQTIWSVNANGSWNQIPIATTITDSTSLKTPLSPPPQIISQPIRPKLTRTLTREGTFSNFTFTSLMTSKSSSEPTSAEISREASTQALDSSGSSDAADVDAILEGQEITCCSRPLMSIPKVALAYSVTGTIVYTDFVRTNDQGFDKTRSEIPYDDEYVFLWSCCIVFLIFSGLQCVVST
jgi:hypothetical protein